MWGTFPEIQLGAKGKTGEDLGVWLQRILGFREKSCHLEPRFLGSSLEARGRASSHAEEIKSLPERNAFPGPWNTGTCRTFCKESPEKFNS